MRPLSDRAFLVGFGRDAQLWQASTGELPALDEALERILQSGYATNLYDSVFYACLDQFPRVDADTQVDRIILMAPGDRSAALCRVKRKRLAGYFAEMERQMRTQYYVSFPPERQTPAFTICVSRPSPALEGT